MNVPPHVAAVLTELTVNFLGVYPEEVQEAAGRLMHDERMRPIWERDFSEDDFMIAVEEFSLASVRDNWTDKTQRERDAWLSRFERATVEILELMQDGPRPPEDWGFPIRDVVLMEVMERLGQPVPPPGSEEYFTLMIEKEYALYDLKWTLKNVLEHYCSQVRVDCLETQELRRPRDAKAARARFIKGFRPRTRLSAECIAIVSSVMFDDESVDGRRVRRLTADARSHS